MFSLISANWAGEPLRSYETILKAIPQACRRCSENEKVTTGTKGGHELIAYGRIARLSLSHVHRRSLHSQRFHTSSFLSSLCLCASVVKSSFVAIGEKCPNNLSL